VSPGYAVPSFQSGGYLKDQGLFLLYDESFQLSRFSGSSNTPISTGFISMVGVGVIVGVAVDCAVGVGSEVSLELAYWFCQY